MSAKIFVGNLPAGTAVEEIREEFETFGAPVIGVEQVEGGNPDELTFVVELDIEPNTAQLMVQRAKNRFFKGRKLQYYAPIMTS